MRFTTAVAAALTATALSGCSRDKAPASNDAARARQEILAVQKQFRAAVRAKDAVAVAGLLTADFIQRDADGTSMSRNAVVAELRKAWPKIEAVKEWNMDLGDVTVDGDSASAEVKDRMTVLLVKPVSGQKTLDIQGTTRTTWQRTPAGWRYHRIAEIPAPKSPQSAAGPNDVASDIHFVPIKQWAKDARREREAKWEAQRRRDAANVKPVSKAPAGMTPQQAREMLTGLYARYRKAVRGRDLHATMAFLTDDYTVAVGDAALPRWEVEKSLRTDFARTRSIDKWDMAIDDVAADGDTLTVVVRETRSAMVADESGRVRRVNTRDRMRDTWVKTSNGWKNQKTEIIPE